MTCPHCKEETAIYSAHLFVCKALIDESSSIDKLEEIKSVKAELEKQILELILQFETLTKVNVTDIDLMSETAQSYDGFINKKVHYAVKIDVAI